MCTMCEGADANTAMLGLLSKIDATGWALVGVTESPGDPGPPFAYTVGLTTFGHPELAIYGLSTEVSSRILNAIGDGIVAGCPIAAGSRLTGLVDKADVIFEVIQMTDTMDLIYVREIYGACEEALQIVWPDARGRLPWQENCAQKPGRQPLYGPAPVR
ncbi:uncharacterized protein DUF4262 [Jatrophihabitans sp. GAS493]|uniref:DUF4262 domain-containing protein n=1 Tax=Jatrophihabitans sp. GAS493 TaxID=1907575 RepID=UPI000BB687BF|nr:DUF4262 domain-containing protein [Jatrophihabitans sp. GAS493]SOD74752.1 uncharacterized protein DUF4262 [Jatrophihabitans sp. GAS493]